MKPGDRCPHGILFPHECKPCADFHYARRPFPILGRDLPVGCPKSIPWGILNEEFAQHNHGQTLSRLAERGGLSPCEALAVIERRSWHRMNDEDAARKLLNYANTKLEAFAALSGARMADEGEPK